jgi:glycosyltransferase involved in cell wall biosynthesis
MTPRRAWQTVPLMLYGVLLFLGGMTTYIFLSFVEVWLPVTGVARSSGWILTFQYACAGLVWGGIVCAAADLFILLPYKRQPRQGDLMYPTIREVTVVLTAYNDELSIGQAVRDFSGHPLVRRVIVVDNNSQDRTAAEAAQAGAIVIHEPLPGYGRCVYRALSEGLTYSDTELTLLAEGDMTFRAYDIDKFLAYIPHADIVNGTRIVEQLRSRNTQLTTFMYYGNFFVGKLLEAKYIGQGTFTDVGTTYKLCWNSALRELLPRLNPSVNLEFNAHFLDTALRYRFRLLECPVTFHNRVGISKGGNASNMRALRVGLGMIKGIVLAWPRSNPA